MSGRFDLSVYVLLLCNSAPGHLGHVTNMSVPASLSSLESGFNIHLQVSKLLSKNTIRRPTTNSVEDCTYSRPQLLPSSSGWPGKFYHRPCRTIAY